MKLVIDLPEELFNYITGEGFNDHLDRRFDYKIRMAVKDAKPLPKGHGELIDKNDLLRHIGLDDIDENREENVGEIITLEDLDFLPTIIEAENTGEE